MQRLTVKPNPVWDEVHIRRNSASRNVGDEGYFQSHTSFDVARVAEEVEFVSTSLTTCIGQRYSRLANYIMSMGTTSKWFDEDASWHHDRAW
ncbi:hypothetical protein TrVGV298_008985 [Trichoderma virens]|nr:hypothetical protein TrVGV298_008985 [Trichoderma virens]